MARSYVLNNVHCVFSTKQRTHSFAIRNRSGPTFAGLRGILSSTFSRLVEPSITCISCCVFLRIATLSDVMRDIKANSSRHMRESGVRFAWQDGYAGISVSPSQVNAVKRYIANQERHHRKQGFDEELVMLLERAGVLFNRAEILG